ncbi:hypothetical protein halTADL_0779 [Halohasta litchfieldiae]|jgi:hypothetical protein|uniref:Uncharacterized protein n=1 Tax=Halohasta litchfieldiae TaxID=1073996 RepID=A0A1H6V2N4_9EURY|nr:hypothetical protein [Halohasta litchfieldiae]ATW87577.1 hypothetical protein halTADL_0779 [Halohasta litchfieldiae]SEI97234.1 hypothetical protein SAMN05444271_11435 [Halohasta litchfieldiae]
MPTVSVDLDEELFEWLSQRTRDHDSSPAAELAALAAEARSRELADEPATELPVGVYEADDGTTVVELGDPETDETDLPVGVYHEKDTDADEPDS